MQALANYIMRGPLQAIMAAVVFALLSLVPVLGVVGVLSGAVVALVALRQGQKQGLIVLTGAAVIIGLFLSLLQGTMIMGFVFALMLWLPVLIMAIILRNTQSWTLVLDTVVGLGAAGVIGAYLMLGDPIQMWQQLLTTILNSALEQGASAELESYREQLPVLARWMTGMLAGAVVLTWLSAMLVARWWQAMLYNPSGFRQEFYSLRLSRVVAIALFITLLLSVLELGKTTAIAGDLMIVAVVIYSLVGLSLVHAFVARTGRQKGWLVAVYVLAFILPPQIMLVLAGLAFADSWLDFRARLPSGNNDGDDGNNGRGES